MPKIKSKVPGIRQYGTKSRYTHEELNKILDEIKCGKISQREASKKYNIPRNTIRNKLTGKHEKNVGRPTIFSVEEENSFVQHIVALSDLGLPISLNDLRYIAKSYLNTQKRKVQQFKENMPGWEWGQAFLERHKAILNQRFEVNISRKRAQVNEDVINKFFDNLEKELDGITASNIYNYDETGFHDIPQKRKLLFKRSSRHPERIRNSTKSCYTTLFCGNADGTLIPPYVIMKGSQKWSDWIHGAPKGTRLNVSKSGWIDNDVFDDWFENHFLPIAKKQPGKKLLIGDNMSAHISLKAMQIAKSNDIKFVFFPPNSTHILQPLDVGYFSSLKAHWRQVLSDWRGTKNGKKVVALPKAIFSQLLKSTMELNEKTASTNLIKGFQATGIYPLNRQVVLNKLPFYATKEEINQNIGNEFKQYLENIRLNDLAATHKVKKFCLPIAAGKSVSVEEVEKFYENKAAFETQKKSNTKKRGRPKTRNVTKIRGGERSEKQPSPMQQCTGSKPFATSFLDGKNDQSIPDDDDDLMEICMGKPEMTTPNEEVMNKCENREEISYDIEHATILNLSSGSCDYNIDDCVIVQYEREFYPGLIIDLKINMYLVRCMEKAGAHWKWPVNNDDLWYNKSDILEKLSPEDIIPISSRGVFSINNSLLGAKLLS